MSKKDKDTRGPFALQIGGTELEVYITNGSIDFSLSSEVLKDVPWEQVQGSISSHMKSLAVIMTDLSKSISQLGTALRSGDPRIK